MSIGLPTYTDIVLKTLSEIDLLLKDYVFDGYHALSASLSVPLGLLATIYICLLGYAITLGWVKISMGNFVKICLKISFIYLAVTQWGWISNNVFGFINSAIGQLGDALISATPTHIPGADGIDGSMQVVLIEFTKLGGVVFASGSFGNLGGWLDGAVLWAFGYTMIGLALFELIIAKVMLAVLFVFTPLMVLFCFFKPLHGVFDRWLGAIISTALLQLFVVAALTFSLSLSYWWLEAHFTDAALKIGNYGTLPIVILGIICIGLIWKAADLAYFIGGAVSSLSASILAAGIIGGYIGKSFNTLNTLRYGTKLLLPGSKKS